MRRRGLLMAAGAVALVAGLAACGGASQVGSSPKATATRAAQTDAPTATIAASTSVAASSAVWPTTPQHCGAAPKVTELPVLLAVTSGHHAQDGGFERVTFEFEGVLPGCDVRYAASVVGDASGASVALAGSAYVQLRFLEAADHTDVVNEVPAPRSGLFPDRPLVAYVVNGDFDGILSVALGLTGEVGLRVSAQPDPIHLHPTITVDVHD